MDVCRICLSGSPDNDIYCLKTGKRDGNKNYSDILQFCLGIEIKQEENITKKLCTICFKNTMTFYKFKTMALINDRYLRSSLNETSDDTNPDQIEAFGIPKFKKDCLGNEIKTEINDYSHDYKLDFLLKLDGYKNENSDEILDKHDIETPNEHLQNQNYGSNKSEVNKSGFGADLDNSNDEDLVHESFQKTPKKSKSLKERKASRLDKDKAGIYPCKFCEKTFKFSSSRWRHIKFSHTVINGHCDICNKDVKHLKNHIMLMHDRAQLRFQCEACGRRFINEYTKRYHACPHRSIEQRGYGCDHCDRTFWCPRDVDRHVRKDHQGEKTFLCQFCSKSFFLNHHLTIHLRTHTNERPFKCPDCDKSFATKTTLRHHQFSHKDNLQFECGLCSKVFARPQYLRHHMIHTHNKDRSRKFPCKYCGVAFARCDTRKTHETNVHEKNMS